MLQFIPYSKSQHLKLPQVLRYRVGEVEDTVYCICFWQVVTGKPSWQEVEGLSEAGMFVLTH